MPKTASSSAPRVGAASMRWIWSLSTTPRSGGSAGSRPCTAARSVGSAAVVALGADDQHRRGELLLEGEVDLGLGQLAERGVLHRGNLADHGYVPGFLQELQVLAQRILARPEALGQGGVDDGHERGVGAVAVGK